MPNNSGKRNQANLPYDILERIAQNSDSRSTLTLSSASRYYHYQLSEERQRALSDEIILSANSLMERRREDRRREEPPLQRFNKLMSQAQSLSNDSHRERTINALHKLVPEKLLSRFNEYDQQLNHGVSQLYQTGPTLFESIYADMGWNPHEQPVNLWAHLPVANIIYQSLASRAEFIQSRAEFNQNRADAHEQRYMEPTMSANARRRQIARARISKLHCADC